MSDSIVRAGYEFIEDHHVFTSREGVLEILCQSFNLSGKRIESWQRNLILKPP